jgi:acetyl esterase/lipase
MKAYIRTLLALLLLASPLAAEEAAFTVKRDIPYAEPVFERRVLDVYAPPGAKNLPVVVWIHGGGWQTGDKSSVQEKPKAFTAKGFVFVSVNYRLLPEVAMGDIIRDVAKSVGWVHHHIAEHGGDPKRLFIMGHSAGAQLAALLCTDEKYLKAEGVSFADVKGSVPVDGDTYDVPEIIAVAAARRKAEGKPDPKFGHREKFGTPEQHVEYSAITHVAKDRGIPPFLLLHVADHPDTTAQAQRFGKALQEAGVVTTVFGASNTNHTNINANLGVEGDPPTKALWDFVDACLKK